MLQDRFAPNTELEISQSELDPPVRKVNLMWFGFVFSIFYWMLEAVRDVLVFEKGTIIERIFFPDWMSFWLRILVVCILVLLGAYAQSLRQRMEKFDGASNHPGTLRGVLGVGLGVGCLYWILEAFRDVFVFNKGSIVERIFAPDPMSFWMRLLAIFIIILFTIYAQSLFNERRKAEESLKRQQEKLSLMVDERTAELMESNKYLRLLKMENDHRHRVERELRRVNRSLKTLSECNVVLARANDEDTLLQEICNILIQTGGYKLAWVGYLQSGASQPVRVMSHAGEGSSYLESVFFTWQGTDGRRNPIGRSIMNKRPCVAKNVPNDESRAPWLLEAIKHGFGSSISIPLTRDDAVFGTLALYAENVDAFDEKEIQFLVEMADDLTFGIQVLRTRVAHQRAVQEKENMQAQLFQARKMEAIGILAGGIAHDFNNLLTAILGSADMARMEIENSPTIQKDLEDIQTSARRAADLTQQLLHFSRKQPLQFNSLYLNSIINESALMLRRLIGDKIQLSLLLDENLQQIRGDRRSIEQVIYNLVLNAKDAMSGGGRLIIETENDIVTAEQCIGISEAQPGQWVRLSITDTGKGIDGQTIKHIFEPFYSTKDVGEGPGLGLSVVYGIVKQHDGWMSVESETGKGAVFHIYLPVVRATKRDEPKPNDITPTKKETTPRVLVVEDEDIVREFAEAGLDRFGFHVYSAASANEAERIFLEEKGEFSAVLCDVVLPDKNGLELVDTLLAMKPKLAVLMCSGYSGPESRRGLIQGKGFRFLEKPYSLNDLIGSIKEVTRSMQA